MANLICRSCAMPLSTVFVDLGLTPISNAFVHPEDAERAEKFYPLDRKSTRLNSSHSQISYAVFCLKKKKNLHKKIIKQHSQINTGIHSARLNTTFNRQPQMITTSALHNSDVSNTLSTK